MDDAIPRSIWLIVLIIAGGFFAGAETSFSYVNTVRLRMLAENGKKAKRAVRLIDDYDMTIVTLLIIINIIHIAASAIATMLFIDITGSTAMGPVLATVIITLVIFIFSETLPKNFARANADAYALFAAMPVYVCRVLLYPLAWLLSAFGTLVKKVFHLYEREPSVTEDEFSAMVEEAAVDDIFEPEEQVIIQSAIEFGDTTVVEIMTPKKSIAAISVKAETQEVKQILINEKYSRFPIYRGSINNIVGVVRSHLALWQMIEDEEAFSLRACMTKPMFCTPDDKVSEIFERMCNRKNHFAVVRDEDEKTVGIVTMEDILEEIVGEIYDEDEPGDAKGDEKHD